MADRADFNSNRRFYRWTKRIVPKAPVQMIISREYVGTQTVTEAFVPIISEDIRKKIAEGDTFDNEGLSA
ncbi:TPA: stage II sporulation protein R [Streptococcus suis]|nr:stage II sporulation protein R [Streptococcus suis]HEM4813184.1 stage II sporulation protein R [Streptococcus suis]HEM4822597.1 stage II sporulation protein R [Streptococcus suis]